MKVTLRFLKPVKFEYLFFLLLLAISFLLMSKTLRVNTQGNLEIATKAWSDFSATIPLIRSFSLGENFPPQYPLFAGPPIRYHFVFFWITANLEKVGLPLSIALNMLSSIVFSSFIFLIYFLGKTVFKRRSVGLISVLLFIFNGSLSFLEFFKNHPLSINTFTEIAQNTNFASFGPYDGKIVSAFWSLNIFTNQRHLALAYAAFLLLVLFFYVYSQKKIDLTYSRAIFLGILIGLFPFIHLAIFGALNIALITFLFIYQPIRKKIIVAGITVAIIALPQILYMQSAQLNTQLYNPGYLVQTLTVSNFANYWLLNLGLTLILAPFGFILAKKNQKKIILPFLALFIIGNLFQFSREISANHKFFNLFVIGMNFFTAYLLVSVWNKSLAGKFLVPVFLLFLTLSGVIDLFPIINDTYIEIKDIKNNASAAFISNNTPRDSVFLNSSFLYDPASLAGRKIFLGWPYFSWSAGYNTDLRYQNLKKYLSPLNKGDLCSSLFKEGIDYIEIQNPTPLEEVTINYSFFENNFDRIYYDKDQNISIYQVSSSCKND